MHFIRSGFRIVRENPALLFAEIAWRWAFGAAAWTLVIFTVRTIMAGIDVTQAEVTLARNSDAYLIADAIARVLIQVIPRFVAALAVVIPMLAVVWIVSATVGRVVTLRELLATCSAGFQPAGPPASSRLAIRVALLNLLRALFSVATLLAFSGTVFLVSAQLTPDISPNVSSALVFGWMCLATVVAVFWGVVNWFLALASIFIVRDGHGVWRSIADSLQFYRHNPLEYSGIATIFGLIRAAALVVALVAGTMMLAAGSVRAVLVASIIVALLYFAIADFLYIARLAAYVELATVPAPVPVAAQVATSSVPDQPPNLELET